MYTMAPKERFKYYKTYHSYTLVYLAYSPLSFEVLLHIYYININILLSTVPVPYYTYIPVPGIPGILLSLIHI